MKRTRKQKIILFIGTAILIFSFILGLKCVELYEEREQLKEYEQQLIEEIEQYRK